jgi:trans-aconitate methyltransferase
MKIKNPFNPMINAYYKLSNWGKVLIFVVILLALVIFFKSINEKKNQREGFEQNHDFSFLSGSKVYDDFYVNIYDQLVYNEIKDEYEIGEIINRTTPTSESIILDIGSGTGHHVALLNKKGHKASGVDISTSMVKKAKENYPDLKFENGDVNDAALFKPNSYTHILCMYFTIYYLKDKDLFFKNCFDWLMPGGYLVVHLVDRDDFDPILPVANPLLVISPQRYAKKRITNSKVSFNNFTYDANFHLDTSKNIGIFKEKFNFSNSKKPRKQEHIFYMETEDEILTKAQQIGFIIQGKIDLMKCAYDYQYLYILTKPS